MAKELNPLEDAIISQLHAELAARGLSVMAVAKQIGRPYSSLRDYFARDRHMPFGVFLTVADAIGVLPDVVISRARDRMENGG